jgi:hypothetical protein
VQEVETSDTNPQDCDRKCKLGAPIFKITIRSLNFVHQSSGLLHEMETSDRDLQDWRRKLKLPTLIRRIAIGSANFVQQSLRLRSEV